MFGGCWAALGHFLLFLPFFFGLFLLGFLKGLIILPITLLVVTFGNVAVILGLWPIHVVWTCYYFLRAQRFGPVLKIVLFLFSPIPIILWPILGIVGSILFGLGYGFFGPLLATFEAVREGRDDKLTHCFVDGTWSTVVRSCTVVRDFTDLCYHSYFSYLDDFLKARSQQPYEIRLLDLSASILIAILGVIADVPLITLIAIAKSPIMLVKGWGRLLQDFLGWEGPFLETVCVPFAALAIVLWPLAVIASVICAFISSIPLGLYAGVVTYQEASFKFGLAYIVSVLAEFDEYSNDVVSTREGSCLPRPNYRKQRSTESQSSSMRSALNTENYNSEGNLESGRLTSPTPTPRPSQLGMSGLIPRSKSLGKTLQEVKMVQIWENGFKTCEQYGRVLLEEGAITVGDIEEWLRSKKSTKSEIIGVGLPAYALICNLIHSAKAGSSGLILGDGTEVNMFNRPQDRIVDWFFEPLLVLKEQIKAANLKDTEELYLKKVVLTFGNPVRMNMWQNGGIPPEDEIRREELHAYSRRIHGIATSVSRFPTFRRRYQSIVKALLLSIQEKDSSGDCEQASDGSMRSRSKLRLGWSGSNISRGNTVSRDNSDAAITRSSRKLDGDENL